MKVQNVTGNLLEVLDVCLIGMRSFWLRESFFNLPNFDLPSGHFLDQALKEFGIDVAKLLEGKHRSVGENLWCFAFRQTINQFRIDPKVNEPP